MSENLPLELSRFLVSAFENHLLTPWGRSVTDARFPGLWDANCAVIENPDRVPRLRRLERELEPTLRATRARHSHLVIPNPRLAPRLMEEIAASGHRVAWNAVMLLRGDPQPTNAGVEASETQVFDERFWRDQRRAFGEFGIADRSVVDQLTDLSRTLIAAGKRWFEVMVEGEGVSLGGLQVTGDFGYIDDVITTPRMRRRGLATAVVQLMVSEARRSGAERIALLVEERLGPVALYERIGFRKVGTVASTLKHIA